MKLASVCNINAFSSSLFPVLEDYFQVINHNEGNNNTFDPWFILSNFGVARRIAKELCQSFDFSTTTGICILANSGIPLGVLVSLELNKPMFFYKREQWYIGDKHQEQHPIYPLPTEDNKLTLIDSHIGSGFTSGSCFSFLQKKGVVVDKILAPVSFLNQSKQKSQKYLRNTQYCFLANSEDIRQLLSTCFKCEDLVEISKIIKKRLEEELPSVDFDDSLSPLRKSEQFKALLSGFFHNHTQESYFDKSLARNLKNEFDSTEESMWALGSQPCYLSDMFQKMDKEFSSISHDLYIGTDILGTIFALSYAWHTNFSGSIFSTYKPLGWSKIADYSGKKCLIFSGRLQSGNFLRRIIKLLNSNGIFEIQMVVMRYAPENVNFPRRMIARNFLYENKGKIFLIS